jgi:competence protein ComEC
LVALFLVCWLLFLNHPELFFLGIGLGLYLWKKARVVFWTALIAALGVSAVFWVFQGWYSPAEKTEAEGRVTKIEAYDDYQRITLREDGRLVIVYDRKYERVSIGDIISVLGEPRQTFGERIEGGFDYQEYLRHQKIVASISSQEIIVIKEGFGVGLLRAWLLSYIEQSFSPKSAAFLKASILGDDDGFGEEFVSAIKDNGIMHLFAVSGLHITLFLGMIQKSLEYFRMKEKTILGVIAVFLAVYVIATDFSPSVVRSALMWSLAFANQKAKTRLSSMDVLSLTFLFLIIINPYYMYHAGFMLSFVATGTVILIGPLLNKLSTPLKVLGTSAACMIMTFPIVINLSNEINLLSPFSNVLYIFLFEAVILPLSMVVLLFPILGLVFETIVIAFQTLTIFFADHFVIMTRFPSFSAFASVSFYGLVLGAALSWRSPKVRTVLITLLMGFLAVAGNVTAFHLGTEVIFLDLNQGDAILIRDSFPECTALIDTGNGRNGEVTGYLKRKGIRKLDYLILTHNHDDHNGEAELILKELKVSHLVTGYWDDSVFRSQADQAVRSGDVLSCGKIEMQILHPDRDYPYANNDSLVIYSKIGDLRFLFMGDADRSIESRIQKLGLRADVIKIGHHGSATSSDPGFLASISPTYAIIQTGQVKSFGFPSPKVVADLNDLGIKVYRTDAHYSIKYRKLFKKHWFEAMKK